MPSIITMNVSPERAAAGLNITTENYLSMRHDGRKAVMYMVDYLASHGFEKVPHKSFVLLRRAEITYQVRALTDTIAFSASESRGKGRNFNANSFIAALSHFNEFLVFDAREMPNAQVYAITKARVLQWISSGFATQQAAVSRSKMLEFLAAEQ